LEATVRAILEEDPDWLGVYLDLVHRLRTDPSFRELWDSRRPKEQQNRIAARMHDEQAASFVPISSPSRSAASSGSSSTAWPCSGRPDTTRRWRCCCNSSRTPCAR